MKISKFILKPKLLVFVWSIFLLSPLLSVFRLYFVVDNPLFGLRIKGFSTLLFYFPFMISLAVSLILYFWFKEFIDKGFPSSHKRTLTVLTLLSALFLVFARLLLDMEYNNYPNFLYEHYGITVSQLEFMSFIAALELLAFMSILVYNLAYKANNVGKNYRFDTSKLERASIFAALVGFSGLLVLSANTFLNWTTLSGGEKGGYETRVGRHYKYLVLLINHTTKEAKIIHPPQGDRWPAIGNQPVIRYFLYPRTLVSGAILDNQALAVEIKEAYFVEIDPNIEETHWPTINEDLNTVVFDEINEVKYERLEIEFKSEAGSVFKINF